MGDNEIEQRRIKIHNKILKLRSIERILLSDKFEDACKASTEDEQTKLLWILKTESLSNLKSWISKINEEALETMSSRKLRELCKFKSVPYWPRLSRQEMMEALDAASLG